MTTALRFFMPKLALLGALLIIGLFLGAGVALAQEAGPVTVDQIAAPADEPTYTGFAGLANTVLTSFASALALLVTTIGIRLWNHIPMWAQAAIDRLTTTDAKEWGDVVRNGTEDAVRSALIQLKMDPASIKSWEEKNATLALAGNVIDRFYPELKTFTVDALDKNRNGVPDFLELALARIAPQTALIAPPAPSQGFMSVPDASRRGVKPRTSTVDVEALAAKFSRRPKGAVTQ